MEQIKKVQEYEKYKKCINPLKTYIMLFVFMVLLISRAEYMQINRYNIIVIRHPCTL